ncbi:hypothetical protein CRUP_026823 [Coryphaenoides rupestris]|nr:hypothetical protein CRUP_026823 [Coryphaenoides rupestris]
MPESWFFLFLSEDGLCSGSSAVSLLMSYDTWRLAGLEPKLDTNHKAGPRRTDSLLEAEERRNFLVLTSEVWLVTVERRVDMKLLLAERRSPGATHSRLPRHGISRADPRRFILTRARFVSTSIPFHTPRASNRDERREEGYLVPGPDPNCTRITETMSTWNDSSAGRYRLVDLSLEHGPPTPVVMVAPPPFPTVGRP